MSKLEFNHRTLPQGYQLGDYVIEDLLGQGGFGIAYLAKDIHLHNNVVIKEYFPNEIVSRDGQTVAAFGTSGQDDFERGMQRFVEEGRALARFNHPAVVRILKYFQQNNTAYLVMEFIDGEPLDKYLKRKETLTPEVVEHLASELLDGLTVVHQHGLIHRDIKPANIMLRPGGKPVLIDFGAAKDALAEKSHSVVVTGGYGAPEQYSSKTKLTPATDLYALGATLYKCLTAQTPEESSTRLLDDEHLPIKQLSIATACSAGLIELIDRCMELKQKNRLQDAQAAKTLLSQQPIRQQPKSTANYSNIESMIEMAGRDGHITQEEIIYITEKAQQIGLDIPSIQNLIKQIAHAKNWTIEQKEKGTENHVNSPATKSTIDQSKLICGRYTDNKDGTVTDIETGLMWQRFSVGQRWSGKTQIGTAGSYHWNVAVNHGKKTWLIRLFGGEPDQHWQYATAFAGYDDWRVPTLDELNSIVDENHHPVICSDAFPNTPARFYWSASPSASTSSRAWGVRFSNGYDYSNDRNYGAPVRLVRSGQ